MKTCGCGETDPAKFYGKGHLKCKTCLAIYNKEYYQAKKKAKKDRRKVNIVKSLKCLDVVSLSISSPDGFKRTCRARRSIPPQKHYKRSISCHLCLLAAKVDGGFIPDNISVMRISLMARMN